MIYTNFSIFKNKYKKAENQPDYKMLAKISDKFIDIGACWIKKSKDGTQYMSCKLSENPSPVLTEEEKKAIQSLKENERIARQRESEITFEAF